MGADSDQVILHTDSIYSVQAIDVRSYQRDDLILEGEAISKCFLVILSGRVEIICRGKSMRQIGEHDVLGLENIFFKKASPISAVALTDCRVASYAPEALKFFLRSNARMTERILRSVVQQLHDTTSRAAADGTELTLDEVKVKFYKDGEVVMREGTFSSNFYRLISSEGGLRVSLHGKEIGRIQKPGIFFGEIESLLNLTRQTTISSIGQSAVQVYPADQLSTMANEYPEVALQMIRELAARLLESHRKHPVEDVR